MKDVQVEEVLKQALTAVEAAAEAMRAALGALQDNAEAVQVPRQGRWTESMVFQVWGAAQHLPGVHALFEVTADQPNIAVTFSQLLERSGLSPMAQRNDHARLSRIADELFGAKRWPLEAWQGSPAAGGHAQMLYRAGPTIAEWWRRAAGEPDSTKSSRAEDSNVVKSARRE